MSAPLYTVGHGTLPQDQFVALLTGIGIDSVVDVRRFPGSRQNPQYGRDAMVEWLPAAGIDYRWEPRLGGRRRGAPDSPHTGLRNDSFRAYADHLDEDEYRQAVGGLLAEVHDRPTAVMCSESVWWRCHRRLIAEVVTLLHDTPVRHVMHDGRVVNHAPTDVATVVDGALRYRPSAG